MPSDILSGVYAIESLNTGDMYIGSSCNIIRRFYDHIRKLRNNCHHNINLQNIFCSDGKDSLKFYPLEIFIPSDSLEIREQWWINILIPSLNIANPVLKNSTRNRHLSDEHKLKISLSTKKSWTEERRKTWSKYKKGKSPWNEGKNQSISACDKISKAQQTNTYPIYFISPEGNVYEVYNMTRFCKEHDLDRNKMKWLAFGTSSCDYNHKGWKLYA